MLASRLHWRLLIGTILVLMAAAWLAPRFIPPPDIQENRVLAAKPEWPKRFQDVRAFRKAADAYVGDHFPARPLLIATLNRVRMLARISGSSRVIVGRDGWLFYDDDTHLGAARGDPPLAPPEMRAWLLTLAGRTELLRARGVPYLVVSPPGKETVYPQHGPGWYAGQSRDRAAIVLPRLARDSGAGDVLYLHPQVAEATRAGQKTFSRHDTHWTGYGAYAGYVGLMDRLHALGLTDGPRPLSEFVRVDEGGHGPRDLALMLGVSSFVDLDYPHFENPAGTAKTKVTYLTAREDWTAPQVVETGEVGKPVLLLTRDSFSNEVLPFLYPHFSRIILTHIQDGFWRPDLIDRFKPDIVVLEVIEPGLRVALGDGPPASAEATERIDAALARATPTPRLAAPDARTAAALAAARLTRNCNVEEAILRPLGGGDATFTGSGWLWEPTAPGLAPDGIFALKGPAGLLTGQVRFDRPRPDVAAVLKSPAAVASGYASAYFVPKLPVGAYTPRVYRHGGSGWIVCEGKQALVAP